MTSRTLRRVFWGVGAGGRARRLCGVAAACVVVAGLAAVVPLAGVSAAVSVSVSGGGFVPVGPVRVLDTRNGTGGFSGPVGAGQSISVAVTGRDGVPSSGVTAVVVNVTAVKPTRSGFVTVYPAGRARPGASNLNFTAGEVIANLVTVPVGAGGKVDFYNASGSVNLVADLAGYYTTGALTSWTVAEAPLPAGGRDPYPLAAVACPPNAGCVAADSYFDASDYGQVALLTGSGSSWTAVQAPMPAGAATSLDPGVYAPQVQRIACSPVKACVAVGSYSDSAGAEQGLLLTGYGSAWTAAQAPLPAGARSAEVSDAACPSSTECVAVGQYIDSSGGAHGLLLTGYGAKWTAVEAPLPAGASATAVVINSVACPSSTACVAGGYYLDSSNNEHALLLTWNGKAWTAVNAPLPAGVSTTSESVIISVACPSSTACVAGGFYVDSSGNQHALLLTGYGSAWTAVEPPLATAISSLACPSASLCVGEGSYYSSGNEHAVLLTGYGSAWTAVQAPLPSGARSGLSAVACPSTDQCVADGDYQDAWFAEQMAIVTGLGSSWTAGKAPPPGNAASIDSDGQELNVLAVACASASACVAIGSYTDTSGSPAGLLLTGPA